MSPVSVRLGFVPSYRWNYSAWVEHMRRESLAAFEQIPAWRSFALSPLPDGQSVDMLHGYPAWRGQHSG